MASRDNRRYTGPEQTTPIHLLLPRSDTTFLSPSGQRADNRAQLDMRKMYFGVSNISQAKGSSYVEMGDTKVVCGIYGPKEVAPSNTFKLLGQVVCEVKFSPFSSRVRRSPIPDNRVRELGKQIQEALIPAIVLEQYPKSKIEVFVSVVEDGGGLLAACVTAASLALCDANINMYDVVVATSLLWHREQMYLDPSLDEEQSMSLKAASNDAMDTEESGALSGGSLTVGLMPLYAKGQMPLMVQSGTISLDQLYEGIDAGLDSCRKVYAIVKQVLLDNVKKINEMKSKS